MLHHRAGRDARYLDTTFAIWPGDSLLLYTDGLVEDRHHHHWRLTAVTGGSVTTSIPASSDASLELATDGAVFASDGVNPLNGTFKAASAGFDVYGGPMTAVGYDGNDPGALAAESGMGLLMSGPPPGMDRVTRRFRRTAPRFRSIAGARHRPRRDPELLTLRASGARLAFVRTCPAEEVNATLIPDNSSAPGN